MYREAESSSRKLRLVDFPIIRDRDARLAGQQSQRTFSPFSWYWRYDCYGLFLATESDSDRLPIAHCLQSFREMAFKFPNAHSLHGGPLNGIFVKSSRNPHVRFFSMDQST